MNDAAAAPRPRADRPPAGTALGPAFFDRDAQEVACDLLGKVLSHGVGARWLSAQIIEAEAYYLWDKASHASLGYTEKRRALFMAPGTLYLYFARGGDSLNVSCRGEGNAVLVKAALPYPPEAPDPDMLAEMQRRNPLPSGTLRPPGRLCAGQTLLCRALGLKVYDWDGVPVGSGPLRLLDVGRRPARVVRTTRLGIPPGRDGHLPFRFIDAAHAAACTRNPVTRRAREGRDFFVLPAPRRAEDWAAVLGRSPQPPDSAE